MNNRIMATLCALAIALFIGVVPVKAEAAEAHTHVDSTNVNCVCDYPGCQEKVHEASVVNTLADGHKTVCAKCGEELEALEEHNFTYVDRSDNRHNAVCSSCGFTQAQDHVDETGDCICDLCNGEIDHVATKHAKVDATCENAGNVLYYECENCHKYFTSSACTKTIDTVTIDALGHSANNIWVNDDAEGHYQWCCRDCGTKMLFEEHTFDKYTNQGSQMHDRTCTECGYTERVNHVDADKDCICDDCDAELAHTKELVPYQAATCTEDGVLKHYKCSTCGKLFSFTYPENEIAAEKIVEKATGHDKSETLVKTDETGHYYTCSKCDEKVEFAEHTPSEWVEYASLRETKHIKRCTVCLKTLEIADHVDADNDCTCDDCGYFLGHTLVHYDATEATCEEDGCKWHYECSVCGKYFYDQAAKNEAEKEDVIIEALGHEPNGIWENDDEAGHYQWCSRNCGTKLLMEEHTCGDWAEYPSDPNLHFHQCTVCYKTVETAEHNYVYTKVEGADKHKRECADCGKYTYIMCSFGGDCVCDVCGGLKTHAITDSNVRTVPAKAATCTEDGYELHYRCEDCGTLLNTKGEVVTLEDVTIKALGHDWQYVKDTLLTHKHLMQCGNCGGTEVQDHTDVDNDCRCDIGTCDELVHTHTHVYVAEVAPSCGKAGTEAYYYYKECGRMFTMDEQEISGPIAIPALEHVASDEYEAMEGGMHAIKCENCGEVMAEEAHTDGNDDNRCDVCNVELSLEYHGRVAPTCTTIGYEEYWESAYTHIKYADANGNVRIDKVEEIPMLGHDWTEWVSNGMGGHTRYCNRCDVDPQTEAHTNTVLGCVCDVCYGGLAGHTITHHDTVAATCTTPGTQEYIECSCGKIYDVQSMTEVAQPIAIPKTGHKLSNELVESSKTGDHYQVCTNAGCDYEYHTDHEPVVEDPLKGNYHQWICECGNVETERHYDKDGDNKCDECGHDMANTSVNVQNHDSVTVVTGEKKTVNNQKSWWQNWLDNLLPSNAGGTSTTAASASNDSASTSGSGNTTSGGSTAADTGSGTTNSGSGSASDGSGSTSSGTGIINEFIQWLSQLFGSWLQGK